MSDLVLSSISTLLDAFRGEAQDALGACHLISVDYENVKPDCKGERRVEMTRLKVSAQSCFLQACLLVDDDIVFKGRAIFKANSAPQER
ncbi:MAG: hypothetical protein CMK09_16320 [Ponticaulis sp.]|nr:hypothetical protein [Ponticaulis sp.]